VPLLMAGSGVEFESPRGMGAKRGTRRMAHLYREGLTRTATQPRTQIVRSALPHAESTPDHHPLRTTGRRSQPALPSVRGRIQNVIAERRPDASPFWRG
jgi:hypothetical protein